MRKCCTQGIRVINAGEQEMYWSSLQREMETTYSRGFNLCFKRDSEMEVSSICRMKDSFIFLTKYNKIY